LQPNFVSWKSLEVLISGLKEALQLREYFVTHDRASLEILAVFVETLSFNFCKECEFIDGNIFQGPLQIIV
jgi:hypothetical protein